MIDKQQNVCCQLKDALLQMALGFSDTERLSAFNCGLAETVADLLEEVEDPQEIDAYLKKIQITFIQTTLNKLNEKRRVGNESGRSDPDY
jgi:hypothetical protein